MNKRRVKWQKQKVRTSSRGYWGALMKNLEGDLLEPVRANPDSLVYQQSDGKYRDLLDEVLEEMPKLLTPKQLHVMQLLMDGFSQEKIARNIGVSPSAVNQHLNLARKKLVEHFKNKDVRLY